MATTPKRTLGEIVTEMAIRLGFGAMGSASTVQFPILRSFVQDAQDQLLPQFGDSLRRVVDNTSTRLIPGQTLYDIPDDADPLEIERIAIYTGGTYFPLFPGITPENRSHEDRSIPCRYMIREGTSNKVQMEVWPDPVEEYPVLFYYLRRQIVPTDKDDILTLPYRLVFLLALANAKAHYRQPDATAAAAQLESLLRSLRSKSHHGQNYRMGSMRSNYNGGVIGGGSNSEGATPDSSTPISLSALIANTGEQLVSGAGDSFVAG